MKKRLFLCISITFFLSGFITAQTVPAGFAISTVGSAWVQPVGSLFSPDGQKLFVWEQRGRIYVCNRDGSGNYIKQSTPVLDISEEVGNWRDHGMLGFAPDPQFATNGLIYVMYIVDRHHLMNFGTPSYNSGTNQYNSATIGRITRYKTVTSGGNLVTDYSTRKILVGETRQTGIPLLYESHGIGTLLFAQDGTLIASTGDGASYNTPDEGTLSHTYDAQAVTDGILRPQEKCGAFRSQMLNSHCGKILRIDPVTGNGLSSNPFYDAAAPRSPKSRVWALGIRNPFRISLKPGTGSTNPAAGDIGELFVSDVSWYKWEEMTVVDRPGMNLGWPIYEGNTPTVGYTALNPFNLDEPNSLFGTGGCTQQHFTFKQLLKQATADNIKTVFNPCNTSQAIGTGNRFFHRRPLIEWSHDNDDARIATFSGNNATTEIIGISPSTVIGTPFKGFAAVSGCWYTGTSFPVKYRQTFFQADFPGKWIKSFKIVNTNQLVEVQEFATGFNEIVSIAENPIDGSLLVVDRGNNLIRRIAYGGNQLPNVVMTSNKTFGPSTLNVNFNSSASNDPNGSIASRSWDFGDGSPLSTAENPSHSFTAPANTPRKYVVKLRITDNQGGQSTDSIIISVNNTPPNVNITSPVKNSLYRLGPDTLYSCAATVTDAEHGGSQLTYTWQTFLRHNTHQHSEPGVNATTTQTLISRIGCNGEDYYWMVQLTVTDAAGLTKTDSSKIFPNCSNSTLPVTLRNFSVTKQTGSNMVKWTTEQEENIAYYEVERCQDGISFQPVHKELSRNIPTVTTYSFDDAGFPAGVNYYRLKITELSGVVKYSLVIKINGEKEDDNRILIAPNPVTNEFSIAYTSADRGMAIIEIWDANGRNLQTVKQNVNEGNNVIYLKASDKWPSGLYYITLQKGEAISRTKFVKVN